MELGLLTRRYDYEKGFLVSLRNILDEPFSLLLSCFVLKKRFYIVRIKSFRE